VVGEHDPMLKHGRAYAFDRAPKNAKSAYLVVPGGHLKTPSIATGKIIAWLKTL
jgi:hypothetical protein